MNKPMSREVGIDVLRDEAQRLIDLEINLLKKMQDVLDDQDDKKTLSTIQVLEGERKKLSQLEMVLAVVGTMKAGKSTTINAIVGTEVLPNRNRPMTALPTLIRHTPSQIEPILTFDNDQPLISLYEKLRSAFDKSEVNKTSEEESIISDPDMKALMSTIRENKKIQKKYHGASSIFKFLKELNDLVRLSSTLGIEFPFDSYKQIESLPIIEVEFVHLRESNDSVGRLTLLDTPGPNESGQPHLQEMLADQLSKASAILAVLDYTQLKSSADAEVREQLHKIADISKGRLYALVNKFDQQDRNSDSEENIKTMVAEQLMNDLISVENVYPVSSMQGYLANRARHEIYINKKLPDHTKEAWVKDFAEKSMGFLWEDNISNLHIVEKAIRRLWEQSKFDVPLERVIKAAHARAAIFAVDSAAAKLQEIAKLADNTIGTRARGLEVSTKELQDQIEGLRNDISRINECEAYVRNQVDTLLSKFNSEFRELFEKSNHEISEKLDYYFKEGKKLDSNDTKKKISRDKKKEKKERQSLSAIFNSLFSQGRSDDQDFNPNEKVIRFDKKDKAKELIQSIDTSVNSVLNTAQAAIKIAMDDVVDDFKDEFTNNILQRSTEIIDSMRDRLKGGGFIIDIDIPKPSTLALPFSGGAILESLITEKTEQVKHSRRQKNVWGKVCGFFKTDDWGWEDYYKDEQYFEVNLLKIKNSVNKQTELFFDGLDKSIVGYVKKPLNDRINKFFESFKNTANHISNDLHSSMNDKRKNEEVKSELIKSLRLMKNEFSGPILDASSLLNEIQTLINQQENDC